MEKDIDNLTDEERKRMEAYCAENCTSRCYNDIDCPHEEEFIELLQEEEMIKEAQRLAHNPN